MLSHFRSQRGKRDQKSRRIPASRKLVLESLEERTMLASTPTLSLIQGNALLSAARRRDTTLPIVSITAPSIVYTTPTSAPLTIKATATDNQSRIANVKFYVDKSTTPIVTDTRAPYSFTWPTENGGQPVSGPHTFKAVAQDRSGNVSAPAVVSVTFVDAAPVTATTTALASNNNPSVSSQLVTFKATVSSGAGTPTGTVTFYDGSTTLGTGTLSGGVATLSTNTLAVGLHVITASYGGDSNDAGSTGTLSGGQTVSQATQAPAITSAKSTTFTVGAAGSFTVTTTGVPTPTLSESGTLPSGVTFNATTGVLSGTPAAGSGGTYPLTFTAHNGVGSDATQTFTLTVNQAPAITSANSTTFTVGAAGSFTVTTTGVPTPTLSESGTLPSGVTFNATTGVLSGTPAAGSGTLPPDLHRPQRRRQRRHPELHPHGQPGDQRRPSPAPTAPPSPWGRRAASR